MSFKSWSGTSVVAGGSWLGFGILMIIWILGISKTSDHIQIKIKITNPSQEHPAPTKAPNKDIKDMDILCNFKIQIESQSLEHGCTKDLWPYSNHDQHSEPQPGSSSILQSTKSGLKGYGCYLHLQKQHRKPKFETPVYERLETISRSRSICQTPGRSLKQPPNPHNRTQRTWVILAPSKSR